MGRVRRRNEKGQNRGFGPLEKGLLGSEDRERGQGRAENGTDTIGGRGSLGPQVGSIRRRFEEETGASGFREGLHGRQKDPALGWDPGKEK